MFDFSQMPDLAKALVAAQAEMGAAIKDAVNPHLKNKYADLASVIDACVPSLNRHGVCVLQHAVDTDRPNTLRLETILLHASGQSWSSFIEMPINKADPQGYGSAMTYARRYSLSAMLCIKADDDDGESATQSVRQAPSPKDREVGAQAPAQKSNGHELEQGFQTLTQEARRYWPGINRDGVKDLCRDILRANKEMPPKHLGLPEILRALHLLQTRPELVVPDALLQPDDEEDNSEPTGAGVSDALFTVEETAPTRSAMERGL